MLNIYLSDSVKMCYAILESRQQKELFLEKIFFVTFERYKIMYVTHLMLQLCPIPLVKGSMAPKRINQGLLLYNIFAKDFDVNKLFFRIFLPSQSTLFFWHGRSP